MVDKDKCLHYFNGENLPVSIFFDKYALRDSNDELVEETPDDLHKRLSREFHRIEKQKFGEDAYSEEFLYDLFKDFAKIIPQGSPLYGIGNPRPVSLSNCYYIDTADSYGAICNTDAQLCQLYKRRSGVGIDISPIRPYGMPVNNASRIASGILPFMERFSNTTREVAMEGRRGALMLSISVHHPQIMDFIAAKQDATKVTGANISVRLTNEFLQAVKDKTTYEQRWPVDSENPTYSKQVSAKEVWDKITYCAWSRAEPGLLFWDTIIRESPADCYSDVNFSTRGVNPSLRHNTKVLTRNGVFPISELEDKDIEVVNYEGEWKKAKCFKSGINKQLYKITFTNKTEIYCTAEHKWPILNTSGNLVNPQTGKVIKRETSALERQDKVYFPSFPDIIDNPNCDFTQEDGFVLGWNLGDGWRCIHNKKNPEIQLYGFIFSKEDVESGISNRVLDYVNSALNRKCTIKQDHDCNAWMFSSSAKVTNERFDKMQACNKKEGIPKSVWTGNKEFIKGFVDGLFSSDGHVEFHNNLAKCRIVLVTAKENLAKDVRQLLNFYGIKTVLAHNIRNGYHRYDITVAGTATLKFAKIFKLSNVKKQKRIDNIVNLSKKDMYANDRNYLVVKSVEKTELYEDVYDITVSDNTHTFLTEAGITGNCGEIPLCNLDSCRLLVVNLFSCVVNPYSVDAYFDFDLFAKYAYIAQRLMDDIVDLEIECINKIIKKVEADNDAPVIKEQELLLWRTVLDKCEKGRRTGLGQTALGDSMAAVGIKYGSNESIAFTDKVYKTLMLSAYRCSVDLAKRFGPFPIWDKEKEKDNPFLYRIGVCDPDLYEDMQKYGRRNIALLTTAPVGTVSQLAKLETVFGVTSGIEPMFTDKPYDRRKKVNHGDNSEYDFIDKLGDKWKTYQVYPSGVKQWMEITGESDYTKSPYHNATANDLDWKQRVRLQAAAQRYIDHSISSCLAVGHSIVSTNQGDFDIEELAKKYGADKTEVGVFTNVTDALYVNNCYLDTVKVSAIYNNGKATCIRLEFEKAPDIICTVNHRIRVTDEFKQNHYWKYAGDLRSQDVIVTVKNGQYNYDKLVNLTEAGVHQTYDLSVPEGKSYIVNGVISHNTINIPESATVEQVAEIYETAWLSGLKGATVYRDKCRDGVLVHKEESKPKTLVDTIPDTIAPKRPKHLPCDIFRGKIKLKWAVALVGKLNGKPYEVFVSIADGECKNIVWDIPDEIKTGTLVKHDRGDYGLVLDDEKGTKLNCISKCLNTEQTAMTRMVSTALRHGVPLKFLVEQLDKTKGTIGTFNHFLVRALKPYIEEGTKVTGSNCPNCKSDSLQYKEGCCVCVNCSWSKC